MFFNSLLKGRQRLSPKLIEVRAQRIEGLRIERIQTSGSSGSIRDEVGALEHAQMLGNRRSTHREVTGQFAHRQGAAEQARKNRATGRITEGVEL